MSTDLWGDIKFTNLRMPVTILREQAALLGDKTDNIIQGEVRSISNSAGKFIYNLYIVAPALGNYRYWVLEITHDIPTYPILLKDAKSNTSYQCSDEDEFIAVLRSVLSSDEVHKGVSSLLNQSQAISVAA